VKIRRSRLTADFVQIPNRTVRDDQLSYMTRGILADLLSRPDGWEATADDLWRAARRARGDKAESRRAFRTSFAQLKEAGYLVSIRENLGRGRFGTVLILYDLPGQTDVPYVGTSAPPAQMDIPAGRTDVPTGGTSEKRTDMPPVGTSVPPARKAVSAGRTDVPTTDVPAGGTSSTNTEKNTEKTGGSDGRRPATGSRGARPSGFAAPRDDELPKHAAMADVSRVVAGLPVPVREALEEISPLAPRTIVAIIRDELNRGLTAERLIERATDRWHLRGYVEAHNDGKIRNLYGLTHGLLRNDCTSPRCDDGTDIDTGQLCRTCERAQEDRYASASPSRETRQP
jgi:hypothetical protein